jgi:hypothetical protein
MVEAWLRLLTRKSVGRGSFDTVEDLLTELFGRRAGRSTQPRLLRVDITLRATLPLRVDDVWLAWVSSMEPKIDDALVMDLLGTHPCSGI